jgi:hypothetical protein
MLQLYQPVTAVNDAPTITSYINFIAVDEDSTFTINISDLMTTNLTYSDIEDATTVGLAIISADQSNGTWAISTNTGTSWTSIDTNTTTGFLVKKDTKNILRFIPNQNFAATTTINFRLWDQSEGTEGSNYTITSIGGTSGFSSTMFALSLTLIPINDSPVAVGTYTVNLTEDNITSSGVDIASIVSNLVTDVDSSTLGVAIIGLA